MRKSAIYLFLVTSAAVFLILLWATSKPQPTPVFSTVIRQDAEAAALEAVPPEADLSNADAEGIRREITSKDRLFTIVCESEFDASGQEASLDKIALNKEAKSIQDDLRVRVNRNNGATDVEFSITYRGKFPDLITAVTNQVAADFVATRNQAIEQEAQRKYEAAREVRDKAMQRLKATEAELAEFSRSQSIATSARVRTNEPKNAVDPRPSPPPVAEAAPQESESSGEASVLEQQLTELKRQRTELLVKRTPQHPLVRDVDVHIARITKQIALESAVPNDLRRPGFLRTPAPAPLEVAPQEPQQPREPANDASIDVARLDQLLAAMKKARQDFEEASANERAALKARMDSADARLLVVKRATASTARRETLPASSAVMGMLLAVGCGAVLAFAGTLAPNYLSKASDVERMMGLPVLGQVTFDEAGTPPPTALRRAISLVRIFSELTLLALLAWFTYLALAEPALRANVQHDPLGAISEVMRRLPFFRT